MTLLMVSMGIPVIIALDALVMMVFLNDSIYFINYLKKKQIVDISNTSEENAEQLGILYMYRILLCSFESLTPLAL